MQSELSFGLVFFFFLSGEQGCMATVRSAMCCLVWSHILQQVFYAERETRRFCRDEVSGWLLKKKTFFFSVCLCKVECVCARGVCVCVFVLECAWVSGVLTEALHSKSSLPFGKAFLQGGEEKTTMKHFMPARFEAFQTDK